MSNEHNAKEAAEKYERTHAVTLESRKRASLSGVMDVMRFNEQEVELTTTAGAISLIGEGLHIAQLNLEEGRLVVEGEIAGIEYAGETASAARGGFFARMFH